MAAWMLLLSPKKPEQQQPQGPAVLFLIPFGLLALVWLINAIGRWLGWWG